MFCDSVERDPRDYALALDVVCLERKQLVGELEQL
jgi:hypothetical protein